MTITITKQPRTNIIVRSNECVNPRLDSTAGWADANTYGPGGAGTQPFSAPNLNKIWSTAPSSADGCGFYYRHTGWVATQQKTASIDVYCNGFAPKMGWRFYHYRSDGSLAGSSIATPVQCTINATTRVSGNGTAPAGTAYTDCVICVTPGNYPQANQGFAISRCLIEGGTNVGTYFDGTTYATGNGTQFSVWEGTTGNSRSFIYDVDPLDIMTPPFNEGWDQTNPGRNTFFDFLDDTFGVVLRTAGARVGTLRLKWGSPLTPAQAQAAASAAAVRFDMAGTFTYIDTDLGTLANFTLAVDAGGPRLYCSDSRNSWFLDVPFREVP